MTTYTHTPYIMTASGRFFPFMDPRPEHIHIDDIAHALANTCRFSGHVRQFYSVAQHSVLVSLECKPKDALQGLLHDASEAYLTDIPTPIKRMLPTYVDWEAYLQRLIYGTFGLPEDTPASVKRADGVLLATEARDLCHPNWEHWLLDHHPLDEGIIPWDPGLAKGAFLRRFEALTKDQQGYVVGEPHPAAGGRK